MSLALKLACPALILILAALALCSPVRGAEIVGECLLLDDIAHFDPAFGVYVDLVFRPVGSTETIIFVAAGTTGAGTLCPPTASDPLFVPVESILTFRIEPTVWTLSENNVVTYAVEALDLTPTALLEDGFEDGDLSSWSDANGHIHRLNLSHESPRWGPCRPRIDTRYRHL